MYYYRVTIYNDSAATVIHEPSVNPADPHLYSCTLTEGQSGEIDSLQFTILPNNPGYELLNSRTTLIEVFRLWVDDGTLAILGEMILGQAILGRGEEEKVFSGRVLTMTPEMEENGLIYKSIVCESRLGYLCDSIQPYLAKTTYWGDGDRTGLEQYLDLVLENHNSQVEDYKKIYRGNVTFHTSTDNVTKGLTYESTWSTITSKLLNDLGGEMQLREGDDGLLYLDYVEELGTQLDEPVIQIAWNMQSIACEIDPTEVITRLIPLGANLGSVTTETETEDSTTTETEDGDYLTIAEVNDGVIYLDDTDAQEKYGIVVGTVQWSDVTQADNLLRKAKEWLASQSFTDSVTLSAVDLNLIGIDTNTIERYNYYRVINERIGLDDYLRVIKKTTDICNPANITYELGGRKHTLSGTLADAAKDVDNTYKALQTTNTTFQIKEAALYTEIENATATIKSDIAAEYVKVVEQTDADGNVVAGYSTTGDIYNAITQTVSQSENSILLEISTKYVTTDTLDTITDDMVTGTVTEYYKSTSSSTCTGGEWTTDTPEWEEGTYIWVRTTVTTGSGDSAVSTTSEPVCITGNTGATGATGEKGDTGASGSNGNDGASVTISSTEITYQASSSGTDTPTGTWSTSVPTASAGQYLWTRTVVTYLLTASDGTTSTKTTTSYGVSYIGADGTNGKDGSDGVSVESITAYYAVSESSTYYPSHGDDGTTAVLGTAILGTMILGNSGEWYAEQPTVGSTEYLWVCFLITYSNGVTSWTEPYCMTDPSTREAVEELEYTLSHSYSTTTEMNAAIEQKIEESTASITSEISGNYVKIDTTTDEDGNEVGSLTTTVEIYNTIQQFVSDSESSILLKVSDATEMAGEGIKSYTPYYAVSESSTYYPTHGDDGTTAVLGTAVLGKMVLGNSGEWTTTQPTLSDGEYCWLSYYVVYNSGETEWTEPTLLTDTVARVELNTLTEQYSELSVNLSSISASVTQQITNLETEVTETIEANLVLEIATDSSGNKYGKISANADYIQFDTGDLIISSKQFSLDASGNATFSGTLNAASGSFSGDIYATSGYFSGTLAANIVTASNIQDAAVTNAAIAAAAVTNTSIASGAVTYDKISVSELSAISADVGTLTAGVIKSSNYVSGSAGVCIDLTNGTAEFSGDVRATSFSLGSAVFSIETTYITEKTIDANGNMASSIGPYDYLKLSTSGSEGLVADAITVTYLGATTAYADGLHSKYVYTQYTINTEDITVRNDVETWYLHCRTGYFTVGLSAADTTVNGTLDVSGSTTISASLTVDGTNTLSVGGNANMYSNAAVWGNLTVVGYVEAAAYNNSDKRLKTELESLSIYDTFFDSLQTGRFRYNFDESGKYHMGMYAQDVEESLSTCGLTVNDFAGLMTTQKAEASATYHGIDEEYLLNYTEFVPILIYQVQQLKSRVAQLESQLALA